MVLVCMMFEGSNSYIFTISILDFLPNDSLPLLQVHIVRINGFYEVGGASLVFMNLEISVKKEDFGKWFLFS